LFQYGKLNMGQNRDRDMIHYKGSSSSTTRVIPNQTAEEAQAQAGVTNYANSSINNAYNLQNIGMGALNNVYNYDFNSGLGNYNNAMTGINQGYSNLANGLLPTEFSTARQNALNTDLNSTIGNAVNSLANRGIINSSVTNSALNGITRNASDTLARNYTSDLGTYGNILNNQQSSLNSALGTNILGQQASYYPTQQYMSMGNVAAQPLQNLFNTMYSGRMGTAGSTTTQNDGGASTMGALGTLGAAAIMCFVAGTKVLTPDGEVNIEDVKLKDRVLSLNLTVEDVAYVMKPCISPDDYVTVQGEYGSVVTTTSTQHFMTEEGYVLPFELVGKKCITKNGLELIVSVNPAEKELVYDLATTGANVYFANGFAVKGCE
jgi:hypothetical protein